MAESREVKALQTISAEVDESQIKVICSTLCIKAQANLSYKLRKRAERLNETYSFITRANSKLQSEIIQAQEGIRSLLIAQENITMANVELKKEFLLAKEKKIEVLERVKTGEKKYENIWLESKGRIESLTFVQRLLKAKDEVNILEQETNKLENDKKIFIEKIEAKIKICFQLDRKRIIELAEFIVHEIPTNWNIIMEKSAAISDLTNELNNLELKCRQSKINVTESVGPQITKDDSKKGNILLSESDNYNSSTMPNLQLGHFSFDALTLKLDEAKIKASNKTPTKKKIDLTSYMEVDPIKLNSKIDNTEGYTSFYNMPSVIYEDNKPKNYATKKLINILEDIKINTSQAQNMMAKVNPGTLLPVDSISGNDGNNGTGAVLKKKANKPIVSEEIEEIDMTNSYKGPILLPPTQFLDISLEQGFQKEPQSKPFTIDAETKSKEMENFSQSQISQEGLSKKKVSFDLSNALEMNVSGGEDNYATNTLTENNANETLSSQLNVSAVSDDGFSKMQDIIMKKHHLDLSPQFVYSKNTMTPLNLQQSEDVVVTSKFFQDKILPAEPHMEEQIAIDDKTSIEVNTTDDKPKESKNNYQSDDKIKETVNDFKTKQDLRSIVNMDLDADIVSNTKRQKVNEITKVDKPVRGFLLSQDDAPMSKSLDVSMNATGFEDGDEDYPGIDSSLLLSPKADIPMPTTAGENVVSQDVPNFLSGLRKTGLSIFGQQPSSEPQPGTSAQNQGGGSSTGFTFSFGGADKKSRGGMFSMFQ